MDEATSSIHVANLPKYEIIVPTIHSYLQQLTPAGTTDDDLTVVNQTEATATLSAEEKIVALLIYAIIHLLSIVGNIMIIGVILGFKPMRHMKINILILNLAVTDLSIGSICMFLTYMPMLIDFPADYQYGSIGCKSSGFIQMLCAMASSYTLLVMSIDRSAILTCG